LPLERLGTSTMVPKGKVRCAAVRPFGLAGSPLAVVPPNLYHEALPHCVKLSLDAKAADPAAMSIVVQRPARTRLLRALRVCMVVSCRFLASSWL
jgi:hypothetical protein